MKSGNFPVSPNKQKNQSTLQLYKSWDNFQVFRVFDFSIGTKIENLETSETCNFFQQNNYKSSNNFRVFRVSDFYIRVKIENLETWKISNFFQQNNYKSLNNFGVFRVFDFFIRVKIENSETLEILFQEINMFLIEAHQFTNIFLWDYFLILQRSIHCLQRRIIEHFVLLMWTS